MGPITGHISSKVAIVVNVVILIDIGAGTEFLVTQQRQSLEADLLERGKMQSIVGAKMVGTDDGLHFPPLEQVGLQSLTLLGNQ